MRPRLAGRGAGRGCAVSRSDRPEPLERTRLHASCVELAGRGVVLLGRSGSGKSDLAVRLIDAGGVLVADDQLEVERSGERLIGRPAAALAGLLEVRGLGIVRLPCSGATPLCLVVQLDRTGRIPRLPGHSSYDLLGITLPCVRVDPRLPSAAAIVKLALGAERVA